MAILPYPPAFGFETKKYHADYPQKRSFTKITPAELEEELSTNASKRKMADWKVANLVKVLGYIPLIGTFVGIYHISHANTHYQTFPEKINRKYHVIRGALELFSLGFLLLIPDIIQTFRIARQIEQSRKALA